MSEFVPYGSRREPQTLALAGRYASISLYITLQRFPVLSLLCNCQGQHRRFVVKRPAPAFLHLHHGSRQSMLVHRPLPVEGAYQGEEPLHRRLPRPS